MISFACPHCDETIRTPDALAGGAGSCPACQGAVTVPQAGSPGQRPAAEAGPAFPELPTAAPSLPRSGSGAAAPRCRHNQTLELLRPFGGPALWIGTAALLLVAVFYGLTRSRSAWRAVTRPAGPAVPDLIEQLGREDRTARAKAVAALGRMGREASTAVPRLVSLLGDGDTLVRLRVVEALGGIRSPESQVVPALIGALDDRQVAVRAGAASSLFAIGKPAVPALAGALSSARLYQRGGSARILRRLGAEASLAAPDLGRAVRIELDAETRWQMFGALEAIGDAAVPVLIDLLAAEPPVAESAALALERVGWSSSGESVRRRIADALGRWRRVR